MGIALSDILEIYGEGKVLALGGAVIGLLFGFLHSVQNFACEQPSLIFGMAILKTNFPFGYWHFLQQS